MPRVQVIGIGAGDPEHLTLQAVRAIQATDVFFVTDQAKAGQDLADARRALIAEHATTREHRTVELHDPPRDRTDPDYEGAVDRWRDARTASWGAAIQANLTGDQTGAFLVWGDPALYDSTIRVLEQLPVTLRVVPGISSVSALAAAHRISWNRVAEPVTITTGRRYAEGRHTGDADVLVMLDAQHAFTHAPDDTTVYWGAYVGTPDELLVAGPVREVEDEIVTVRTAARARKGWIMDTYLLRRSRTTE